MLAAALRELALPKASATGSAQIVGLLIGQDCPKQRQCYSVDAQQYIIPSHVVQAANFK